ncbi:MAG: twin-arginine translocation signal domain-containing protein [Anaerolineales bacterium]|nr:twin-arginine translocation signal domain-containing protein [Anaerolineales bacterium]
MQARKLTRRDFLKFGGALAVTSTLAACVPGEENAITQPFEGTTTLQNPVITPEAQTSLSSVSMAILALSRLTFGIRPRDVDSFNALGATDDERLSAFVNQQLNPDSIDDSEFDVRYANAGFETLHKSLEQLYADHIASNPYDSNDDAYWQWYSKPTLNWWMPPS